LARKRPDQSRNTLAARSAIALSDRQRLSWLRLIRSENVGPATLRALVNQFGGAEAALDALPALSPPRRPALDPRIHRGRGRA
jgi:DNA processing protein